MKEISFRYDVLPLKDKLFALALRITLNREEAEDIVQDTLLRIWDKRADWTELDNIEAFGITICRNLSLDRVEKRQAEHLSRRRAARLYRFIFCPGRKHDAS